MEKCTVHIEVHVRFHQNINHNDSYLSLKVKITLIKIWKDHRTWLVS